MRSAAAILAAALLPVPASAGVAASPLEDAAAPALRSADFDLAAFRTDAPAIVESGRAARRRYLAPELDDPPGEVREPARLRIRGRKVKLRIPIG